MKERLIDIESFNGKPVLRIRDIDAMVQNYRVFNTLATKTSSRCAPVVKGNVHGLGLAEVIPSLLSDGVREFFVEETIEGVELRGLIQAIDSSLPCRIFVMAGLLPGEENYCRDYSLTPCLNSIAQFKRWNLATQGIPGHEAAVYFDCDMNRIGLSPDEVSELSSNYSALTENFDVVLYMTHLYNIKGNDHSDCHRQRVILEEYLSKLPKNDVSVACTDSVTLLSNAEFNYDLIRPGIGLVGGAPNSLDVLPGLKGTFEYYAKISDPKEIRRNSTVGYGGSFTVHRDTKIVMAHIGYKDGYIRGLSRLGSHENNGGWMAIGGYRVPIIGKISLGLTALDVTDLPDEVLAKSWYAEVLGPNVDMREIADVCGCYEFLAALGRENIKIQDYTLSQYLNEFPNKES